MTPVAATIQHQGTRAVQKSHSSPGDYLSYSAPPLLTLPDTSAPTSNLSRRYHICINDAATPQTPRLRAAGSTMSEYCIFSAGHPPTTPPACPAKPPPATVPAGRLGLFSGPIGRWRHHGTAYWRSQETPSCIYRT